ncbi:hypothetical protein [Rhizobium sp. 42MFCr.1]|uniref:hypothetical protein n=1 Tax=Rhizobium sp. 42MFCr.1 TaxID=1048680 RepID=UPI00035F6BDC|nr:hypothetical protein [Rhizobium sp. 42MFCr.1]
MSTGKRQTLFLPGREPAQIDTSDHDRRVELGTIDALLPCRNYEVSFKVAALGLLTPTLEFLLRLVKATPGIDEEKIGAFFGFSQADLTYVMNEAIEPGYVERREGRVWLTISGDKLFRDGEAEPTIFSVEQRRRVIGFDLMSVAPQHMRRLDDVENALPELLMEDGADAGRVKGRIPDRFKMFFRQLAERSEKERSDQIDLYSIDRVTPQQRFSAPVRIRIHSTVDNPNGADIDLSSWRDAHEVADRREIERAAAIFVKRSETTPAAMEAFIGYELLIEFAPDFLKEYTIRNGLSVRRYWREAASRAGEARIDRKTIAITGALHLQENVRRLYSVLDYAMRESEPVVRQIISVAPQVAQWGATSETRDLLTALKRKLGSQDGEEPRALCLSAGKPARYVERTFDEVMITDTPQFPRSLEILAVSGLFCAVLVHAPIGDASGYPVPLGFASFDPEIVKGVISHIDDRSGQYRKL